MAAIIRFSPSTLGWYPTAIFPKSSVPVDAVDVPMSVYEELTGDACVGKDIVFDEKNKRPVAVERTPA